MIFWKTWLFVLILNSSLSVCWFLMNRYPPPAGGRRPPPGGPPAEGRERSPLRGDPYEDRYRDPYREPGPPPPPRLKKRTHHWNTNSTSLGFIVNIFLVQVKYIMVHFLKMDPKVHFLEWKASWLQQVSITY